MKKYILIVFLLFSIICFAQKKDITGTYFMTFGEKGYQGCCKESEVLRLNKDRTFSFYANNDQGDYQSEDRSFGKFNINGDSIFFLSQISYPIKQIECLPFNDFIDSNVFRIEFSDKWRINVREFVDNDYFAVDDSFKITPVKVIKTIPNIPELLDTTDNRIYVKLHYQDHIIRKFQVYLEKPKANNLMIVRKNIYKNMPGLTLSKQFLQTNNIVINLEEGIGGGYSGYHFKVNNDDLKPLKPVNNGAGIKSEEVLYKKLTVNNFDSLTVQVYEFDSLTKTRELIIKKDKSVKFDADYYNPKTKLTNKREKIIHLTTEKYNQCISKILEMIIGDISDKNYPHALQTRLINLYFKYMHFENDRDLLSNKLYQYLFTELIGEKK